MVDVDWDDRDAGIIRLTLHDDWRWESLYEANNTLMAMMNSADQPVFVVMDYTRTATVPLGGVIMHMRNILSAYPANWAMIVVVTQNMLVQRLMAIFQTTFRAGLGKKVRIVANFNDAYSVIGKQRVARTGAAD